MVRQERDQGSSARWAECSDPQAQHPLPLQGGGAETTTPEELSAPVLVASQGDPAGIGPELLLKATSGVSSQDEYALVVVAERAALDVVASRVPGAFERLRFASSVIAAREAATPGVVVAYDPVASDRWVEPGRSGPADAAGALVCLDAASDAVSRGLGDALVTLPVSKASIATHVDASFRGHTDYLAAACDLESYGRDYLMGFVAPDLRVALLTVHQPLREALDSITTEGIVEACRCLSRVASGRIAVPGLNPHAGEGGLLGDEEAAIIVPAVEMARREGLDVVGPESPDSIFGRARQGAAQWVLALYHDQGLIAVKSTSWGLATNWTIGLPYLRTSVDHGTAFDIAGEGVADVGPLRAVLETTVELVATERSRKRRDR